MNKKKNPVEVLKEIRTQILIDEQKKKSQKHEMSELDKIKQALCRVECFKAMKRAEMLGTDAVATRLCWELSDVLKNYCKDKKFIQKCCKISFCMKDRILWFQNGVWKIFKWSQSLFYHLKDIRAQFISMTGNGVKVYRLSPYTFRAKESERNIFESCKGERTFKKSNHGGCMLPYQNGLRGGATRHEDADANRISNWGIIIK